MKPSSLMGKREISLLEDEHYQKRSPAHCRDNGATVHDISTVSCAAVVLVSLVPNSWVIASGLTARAKGMLGA